MFSFFLDIYTEYIYVERERYRDIYINIYIYIYVDIYTEIELFKHKIVLFLMFWETSILFSIEAGPIYIPTNRVYINTVYNKTRHGSNPSSHQQTN